MLLAAVAPPVRGAPPTGQTPYDWWAQHTREEQKNREAVAAKIAWTGEFSADERQDLVAYFDTTDREFDLSSHTHVLRTTLNREGQPGYVVTAIVQDPKPFYFGEVLLVLRRAASGFERLVVNGPIADPGIVRQRQIQAVDLDGDGLPEVVDQRSYHIGSDEPSRSSTIFKNEGVRFRKVYEREIWQSLEFEDLDNDGRPEVLEAMNDFSLLGVPITAYWTRIYGWRDLGLAEISEQFRPFYARRADLYRSQRADKIRENETFKKLHGTPNLLAEAFIKAMDAYLERIAKMQARAPKKP